MLYFPIVLSALVCITRGSFATPSDMEPSNFKPTDAIKEATEAFTSQLKSSLTELSSDLHGLPENERSLLVNTLHSTLSESFSQRLVDEVKDSKETGFQKDQSEVWSSVKTGMASDLHQFLVDKVYSKSSLNELSKRDETPAKVPFKTQVEKGLNKIGMGLDSFYKLIYYKGIKIPFYNLRYYLHHLWLKIKFFFIGVSKTVSKNIKAAKMGDKDLSEEFKNELKAEAMAREKQHIENVEGIQSKRTKAISSAEHAYKIPYKGFRFP
jgi:hypothetical protein